MPAVHKRANAARAALEREYPFQVALQDDLCIRDNLNLIDAFCRERGLEFKTKRINATFPCGKYVQYRIHCFRLPWAAELFAAHFGAEPFDWQASGGQPDSWARKDVYHRLLESGPLRVPRIMVD